jgi:hypothetical protein
MLTQEHRIIREELFDTSGQISRASEMIKFLNGNQQDIFNTVMLAVTDLIKDIL